MMSHSFTSTKPAAILVEAAAFSLSSWALLGYFFAQYSGVFVSLAAVAGAALSVYRIITHYLDRKELKKRRIEADEKKKAAEARERRRL